MAVSTIPVVVGAATNGPPPPAPSIYKNAIFLPSRDQRGRAAYPVKLVSCLELDPLASTVQSCFWSALPAAAKKARTLESGDHAGSESVRLPPLPTLTSVPGAFPDTLRM